MSWSRLASPVRMASLAKMRFSKPTVRKLAFALSIIMLFMQDAPRTGRLGRGEDLSRRPVRFTRRHDLHMDLYVPRGERRAGGRMDLWRELEVWEQGIPSQREGSHSVWNCGGGDRLRFSQTAKYPAQLEDCEAAVEWLRENGAGMGSIRRGSARAANRRRASGGLLGTVEGRPRIRAVFAMYPPTDLVAIGREYSIQAGRATSSCCSAGRLSRSWRWRRRAARWITSRARRRRFY